jgi:hypothetical protein
VIGRPFPFESVMPLPGALPDGWSWPVEPPCPVGEEAVVVGVDAVGVDPVGVDAVGVEVLEEGAVVVAEPSLGVEAAGAEVEPVGEAGPSVPRVLGTLGAAGFAEDDGAAPEDGPAVLAGPVGGAPVGAAVPAPAVGGDPGVVAPVTGLTMPDASG